MTESTVWAIPTTLDWPAARARVLARADAVEGGQFLQARFFVGHREVRRLTLNDGATAQHELPDRPWPGVDWARDGAVHVRVGPQELTAPPPDPAGFAVHADAALLARFVRHLFYIPIGRGLTEAFAAREFPGHTWQGVQLVLRSAEILVGRGVQLPVLMPTVAALHFDDATRWLVEWADGSRTWAGGATG